MSWTPVRGIKGAVLVTPEIHNDERGFFAALDVPPVTGPHRWCMSRSANSVIRGLHIRVGSGEAKLVRCSAGAIFDVIVDLRRDSPTYRKWVSFLLNGTDQLSLYIPPGCAHGYQALRDDTDVVYRIDAKHDPKSDVLISWKDPELAIPWPRSPSRMTERDQNAPTLAETGL